MKLPLMIKLFLMIFVFCIIAVIVITVICRRWIKIVRVQIIDDKIAADHRFVLISDLHNCVYGKNNEKLVTLICEQNPEYVLIAGDLLVYNNENTDIVLSFLRSLSHSLNRNELSGIIYVFGNHELKFKETFPELWEQYLKEINKLGIIVLNDESYDSEDIYFSGYTNKPEQFLKFKPLYHLTADEIREQLPEYRGEKCNFLITHHPEFFNAYADWGADRVVAGHLHGGIVRLPFVGGILSPQTFFAPKFDLGTYYKGKVTMTVSSGLGDHTVPFRIFNRRDITVIELKAHTMENTGGNK